MKRTAFIFGGFGLVLFATGCANTNEIVRNYYEDGIYYDPSYGDIAMSTPTQEDTSYVVQDYDYYDPQDVESAPAVSPSIPNSNIRWSVGVGSMSPYSYYGMGWDSYYGSSFNMGMGYPYYSPFYSPFYNPYYSSFYNPYYSPYYGFYSPWYNPYRYPFYGYPGYGYPGYGYYPGGWSPIYGDQYGSNNTQYVRNQIPPRNYYTSGDPTRVGTNSPSPTRNPRPEPGRVAMPEAQPNRVPMNYQPMDRTSQETMGTVSPVRSRNSTPVYTRPGKQKTSPIRTQPRVEERTYTPPKSNNPIYQRTRQYRSTPTRTTPVPSRSSGGGVRGGGGSAPSIGGRAPIRR